MINTNVFTNQDESIVFYFNGCILECSPAKFPYFLNRGWEYSTSPNETIKTMIAKYNLREVTDKEKSNELRKKASTLPKIE